MEKGQRRKIFRILSQRTLWQEVMNTEIRRFRPGKEPMLRQILILLVFLAPFSLVRAATWSITHAPVGNWAAIASSSDGQTLVAALIDEAEDGEGGIYVSENAGETWTRSHPSTDLWSAVACSADGGVMLAASSPWSAGGSVYISTNRGAAWNPAGAPPRRWTALAASSDGTKLFAAATESYDSDGNKVPGGIFVSEDSGQTWRETAAPDQPWSAIATSADGSRLIAATLDYTGGFASVYISTNGGLDWSPTLTVDGFWTSVASSADGSVLAACARNLFYSSENGGEEYVSGKIFVSKDAGASWTGLDEPETTWNSIACSADGSQLIAASQDGEVLRSMDGGSSWTLEDVPALPWRAAALSANGQLVALAGYRPPVGAGSPPQPGAPIYTFGAAYAPWIITQAFPLVVAEGDPASFTVAVGGTDLRYEWRREGIALQDGPALSGAASATLNFEAVSPAHAGAYTLVASNALGTVISESVSLRAATWKRMGEPGPQWLSIAASLDGSRCVAGADDYDNPSPGSVWLSSDSGLTWRATEPLTTNSYVRWNAMAISADGSRIFAGESDGVYVSADAGATWTNTLSKSSLSTIACSLDGMKVAAASGNIGSFSVLYPGAIHLSDDGGATWRNAAAPTNYWTSLAISGDGTKIIASVGGVEGTVDVGGYTIRVINPGPVYLSSDSGLTWQKSSAPETPWQAVACSADGEKLFAASGGYVGLGFEHGGSIHASADGGKTWQKTSAPERVWKSISCSADGSRLVATCGVDAEREGNHTPLYFSTDGGLTWVAATLPAGDPSHRGYLGGVITDGDWPCAAISGDGARMLAVSNGYGIWLSAGMAANPVPLHISFGWAASGNVAAWILSWPSAPGIVAQQCTDLTANLWSTLDLIQTEDESGTHIVVPNSNDSAFFRLLQP